ncbi:MAG: molecular chaperone GrpE [Candidatus Parcubacteria bacterium]|jgi:molecular chaperone GrpE|nr:molecular chaperone GrpE [Candidatus Parcubacteria bacterium]
MHKETEDNSIVPESEGEALDDSVMAEENAAQVIKKLRGKFKKAEAEKQEYLTGWQRAKADMINARKRDETDKADFVKFANENLIAQMVPVLESIDLARADKEAWEKTDKNWRTGIEHIFSQLKNTLAANGLAEIDPIGEKYDHAHHEAVSYEPVTDTEHDHVILKVVQKGYSLNGKTLKAPRVIVGEFK